MRRSAADIEEAIFPLLTSLSAEPQVSVVLCFGSYALGTDDSHSDIDLFVLYDPTIPEESVRKELYAHNPRISHITIGCPNEGWDNSWCPICDKLKLGEVTVDLCCNTTSWIHALLEKVIDQGLTSTPEMPFRPYTILGLLDNAVILHDRQNQVRAWVSRLRPYPRLLKRNLIDQSRKVLTDRVREIQDYANRGIGPTAFLFHLAGACDSLVSLLLAVNERYECASKRPERELGNLRLAPPNLVERYVSLLEGPFDQIGRKKTADAVTQLVDEIDCLAID